MSLGNQSAYPYNHAIVNAHERVADVKEYGIGETGMTIRQRYAMAAMQGFVSDVRHMDSFYSNGGNNYNKAREMLCTASFKIADAMIAFEENESNARGETKENETSQGSEVMGDQATQE